MLQEFFITHCTNGTLNMNPFTFNKILALKLKISTCGAEFSHVCGGNITRILKMGRYFKS